MTIKVVNKYKEPNHIYCGRGSALGNPYTLHQEKYRNEVCDAYQEHFDLAMDLNNKAEMCVQMRKEVARITELAKKGDINLGCFCAPKRCHCDTIKAYIEKQLEK